MILDAAGLTVRYPGAGAPALVEGHCTLSPGDLVSIVGPNGCGKTTLLRAILGLVPVEAGSVTIGGRALGAWTRRDLARFLGVVAQREELLFPLSVEETVLLGRYAHLGPLEPAREKDHAAVEAALRRCDILALRHRRVDELSGGEWQRVRVARALAQEPQALLLDEPTAALDIRHEMEVFELVADLVRGGIAALVVTHHINLAARYATRMVLMSQGRIVAEGHPRDVLRQPVLEPVFEWPVAVRDWFEAPQVVPLRPGESSP